MFDSVQNFLAKRLLRKQIGIATETLYSERFDFDPLVKRLSQDGQGVALLRAYVAIEIASRLEEPLTDKDVDGGVNIVTTSAAHADSPSFSEILDTHEEIAKHFWTRAHLSILRGSLAHKINEYSFNGGVYDLQRHNKGPVSRDERDRLEVICGKMATLNRQIEQTELMELKKQDKVEYERYKAELEAREMQAEIDSLEDEEIMLQGVEVYAMLRSRLTSLLRSKH
jgi:hypothetical protein